VGGIGQARSGLGSRSAVDRRQFLARSGILGAVLLLPGTLKLDLARGLLRGPAGPRQLDPLLPVLQQLSRDAFGGLVAYVVPGPDAYSQAQGVTSPEPGAVDARGIDFVIDSVDRFFPLPDDVVRLLVQSLATAATDSQSGPLPLPPLPPLPTLPLDLLGQLQQAVSQLLASDNTVPLSLLIALFLNFLATTVEPGAVVGPFPTAPFANLQAPRKAEVFRRVEQDTAGVVASIDANLSEPARQTVSGLLTFLPGALLEFGAYGAYHEWGVFDPAARDVTATPVGWPLSNYLAGSGFRPVSGWDDFLGYFEGRTQVGE
jgi:hypothetical protein